MFLANQSFKKPLAPIIQILNVLWQVVLPKKIQKMLSKRSIFSVGVYVLHFLTPKIYAVIRFRRKQLDDVIALFLILKFSNAFGVKIPIPVLEIIRTHHLKFNLCFNIC